MMRFACGLLLLAVAACSASSSRIVGGSPASIERYPSLVQIQNRLPFGLWLQSCAGSILTTRYVMTAARCFSGPLFNPTLRRIIAGSSYRNTGGVVSYVARAINHPFYMQNFGNEADIAVILLQTPLVYSNLIQQATIIGTGVAIPDNMAVIQAGWGITLKEFPDIRGDVLQEVVVFTVNNKQCAENYANRRIPRRVTNNMICAGRPEGGAGACLGDSGGPLYVGNIVIGVVSWGVGCTNGSLPRVHTSVASFSDWIVDNAV